MTVSATAIRYVAIGGVTLMIAGAVTGGLIIIRGRDSPPSAAQTQPATAVEPTPTPRPSSTRLPDTATAVPATATAIPSAAAPAAPRATEPAPAAPPPAPVADTPPAPPPAEPPTTPPPTATSAPAPTATVGINLPGYGPGGGNTDIGGGGFGGPAY